jgi:hypothetical protein
MRTFAAILLAASPPELAAQRCARHDLSQLNLAR